MRRASSIRGVLTLLCRYECLVRGDNLSLAVATARDPVGKVGWSALPVPTCLSLTVFDPQGLAVQSSRAAFCLEERRDFGEADARGLKLFRISTALVKANCAGHNGLGLHQKFSVLGIGDCFSERDQAFS